MVDRAPGTADWPPTTSGGSTNAQVETQPLEITPPADTSDPDAANRFVKQQWIDVAASDIGARHPLSINRDSGYVTDDPYST